ncbi:MAG: PHP domain-containing protein [Kiritimatiellae bacterium]|nr:PHP domain-containing protein [Kiritimatiellia bacterium]
MSTIDLHLHSTFSDGSFSPEQLVRAAKKAGLAAIALTDHDSVSGVPLFLEACRRENIRGVPGVEISVDYPRGTMHILGYFIDCNSRELNNHIEKLKAGRAARNERIMKKLNNLGIPLTLSEVASFAGEGNVGRLHFAQALVARGYVKSNQEAFDRYLGKGRSGYVERRRLMPRGGVEMIVKAGGLAVLAHPFTLELNPEALTKLVAELAADGLQGIEVYYPQHNPNLLKRYLALAQRFNLVATGGTDFHGRAMPDIKIGRGFGTLNVPAGVLDRLEERRAGKKTAAPAAPAGGNRDAE